MSNTINTASVEFVPCGGCGATKESARCIGCLHQFTERPTRNAAPPIAPAEKYDDVLMPFLSLMRKELHANSRKGDRPGWLSMDANTALLEVYWHSAKLSAAVKNNDGPAIQEHSADVANMAMMVLDICGGLAVIGREQSL